MRLYWIGLTLSKYVTRPSRHDFILKAGWFLSARRHQIPNNGQVRLSLNTPNVEYPHPSSYASEYPRIGSQSFFSPVCNMSPRGCRGRAECLRPSKPSGRRDGNFRLPLAARGLAHHFQDMAPEDIALGQNSSPFTNTAGAVYRLTPDDLEIASDTSIIIKLRIFIQAKS